MANEEHLAILKQGVDAWNAWREEHYNIQPDLAKASLGETDMRALEGLHLGRPYERVCLCRVNFRGANLSGTNFAGVDLTRADLSNANLNSAYLADVILTDADLSGADLDSAAISGEGLSKANFRGAYLGGAYLGSADLSGADLSGVNLGWADLKWAKLMRANLTETRIDWADLTGADLTGADLTGADLTLSRLVETNFEKANLTGCSVYGVSTWNVRLNESIQADLKINRHDEPMIAVDNLEVAQFIYLLLNNERIRDVIDTIGKKAVLILGRFSEPRKQVLDALRSTLRQKGYAPIVFDFERPTSRDFTETIKTLAGLCLFVIADITNPRSSPLELQATVPDYMIPFIPILEEGEPPFAMFQDLQQRYNWVAQVIVYDTVESLVKGLDTAIIRPALQIHNRLLARKAEGLRSRHVKEITGDQ